MIELINVNKTYPANQGPVRVLRNINLRVERGEKLGILGRNGAGKSTLIRLLGGAELPTSGTVIRDMSISWPLAFSGGFQGSLTGLDNLRFICRIYGVDHHDKVDYVEEFSELGRFLKEPVKTYSSGMRARLGFAMSMVVDFDCFLIDEIVSVGDARFHEKCQIELFEKRADRAMIIVSHDAGFIRQHCTRVGLIADGEFMSFDGMEDGYAHYDAMLHPA